MLQKYLPVLFVLGCMLTGSAQIKIGENPQNIHPASVLELESNNRALVITRVSTQEMDAIVPLQGAMVYNNDTQCIHFYDGNGWLNLCDALGLSFSTDPVVNPAETIVITETDGNRNFEVGQITGMNIVDFSIGGIDLQNNSITANKLAANSVGSEELQDNTVTDAEIDYNVVTLNDFLNDANFITGADIVSPDPGNDITFSGGAFFDATPLQNSITTNTNNLNSHIAADGDLSSSNEIQNLSLSGTNLTISGSNTVDLSSFNNTGSDDQTLTLSGNTLSIEDANSVNLSPFLDNTDNQTLSLAGNVLSISGGNNVTIPTSDGSDTAINAGSGISVSGSGAGGDPYVISNAFIEVDGSTTNELQNLNEVLADGNDAGGQAILNIIDNPSPTSVVTKAYVDAQVGGGGSTELADQVTIVGDGTLGNEFEVADGGITTNKIAPGAADQILRTDPTGTSVAWVNLPAGGGTTEEADQITITGIGTNADPFKIEPSMVNGQFLRTDPTTGNVIWDDLPAGTGGAVNSDGVTITGDGVATDLQVINGGITTTQIADGTIATADIAVDAVTPVQIDEGTANQILTTNATGDVVWADPTAGAVTADLVTIIGDGTPGNALQVPTDGITSTQIADGTIATADIAVDAVTPVQIDEGTANQVLTTNATGDVVWADPAAGAVTADQITITGDGTPGNALQVPTDGITTTQIADGTIATIDLSANAVTTTNILDNNVTPAKIEEGVLNQVLTTNAAGDVVWADPATGAVAADQVTITGDGTPGNALQVPTDGITTTQIADGTIATADIAVDAVTPVQIDEGTANQVLTTNTTGDVVWADPTAGAVTADLVTITGDGTPGNALQVPTGGITTTQIADGTIATADIAVDAVTPVQIDEGTANQVLTTNTTGDVVWADPTAGAVTADLVTITGDGTPGNALQVPTGGITTTQIADGTIATADIALDAVTPVQIDEGTANQVLTTNATGDVVWADPTAGAVTADLVTITGDGTPGNALQVPTGGITTTQIADGTIATADIAADAVTPVQIDEGAANQVLTTNTTGDVVWADPTAGAVTADLVTITGDGTPGNALQVPTGGITTTQIADGTIATADIAADAVTPVQIDEGTANQILTTNATGDVVWADPTAGAVTADLVTITGDGTPGNALQVPTGGITTTQIADGTIATADIANNAITTSKILDSNVTPAKISAGNDNEVLTSNGGNVSWQSPSFVSPIKAFGRVSTAGNAILISPSVIPNRTSQGNYSVSFPGGLISNAAYIIQLSVKQISSQRDYSIYITGQNINGFTVQIQDENNFNADAEWSFTIIE